MCTDQLAHCGRQAIVDVMGNSEAHEIMISVIDTDLPDESKRIDARD